MNYKAFYDKLLQPVVTTIGEFDDSTLSSVVGFDAGGPLSFRTITESNSNSTKTYVSCELAVRQKQLPSSNGRFELMAICDDEDWVRSVLTNIGEMSFDAAFDHGHTLDIGPWVDDDSKIQGVMFDCAFKCEVDKTPYCILRVVGLHRDELAVCQRVGVDRYISILKDHGIFPATLTKRDKVQSGR